MVPRKVVKRVQRKLNNLGFKAGSADGIFGGKTAAAIRRYQKTKNLTVTGKITDDLLRRLGVENTQDFMDGVLGLPLGGSIKPKSTALIYFYDLDLFTKSREICYQIHDFVFLKTLQD